MRAAAVLVWAGVLALTGCAAEEPKGETVRPEFAELRQRPDIEQAETTYQDLLAELRTRLVAEAGIEPWVAKDAPVSGSGCVGAFAGIGADGEVRRYSSGSSPGNLPDAGWPRAVALVAEIAGRAGFGAPVVVIDRPGDHEVSLPHPSGAELLFGTAANTTLSLSTGCHLTAEAHRRGDSAV